MGFGGPMGCHAEKLFRPPGRGVVSGCVLGTFLMWACAALLAAGLAVSQVLLGGWWYPALAAPGLLLVGAAAVVAGIAFWRAEDAPGAWCVGTSLLFGGYLFWRQSESPDWYAARDDTWLLLGALSVYTTAAWQLRRSGPRWLLVGVLLALATVQVFIMAAQFAAESPFHPFPDLARNLTLPRGGGQIANHGWTTGTLGNRTGASGVLQFTTFLALGLLVWGRGGAAVKLLLLWAAATGFAGLAMCLSRSAYLGIPAGLAVFALASFFVLRRGGPANRGWLAAGALAVVVISLGVGLGIGSESVAVQLRLASLRLDAYRENLWFVTVPPMLGLEPWTGAGANMFDQLSVRYRGTGFTNLPVHAHNDWLQLRIEYGRIGLALGAAFFAMHIAAGWRNALRLAREAGTMGLVPQGMTLGLAMGALGAFVAQGVHAVFDYGLHVPAVALLSALGAGWLAGARRNSGAWSCGPMPRWMKVAAVMPAVFGMVLVWMVARDGPSELRALQSENALRSGDPGAAWDVALEGLELGPDNPRLLMLAGESAGQLGNDAADPRIAREWYWRSAQYFGEAVRERPFFAHALRENALALDWSGHPQEALPVFLRAIARDPDHARGYEYLALHYWREGRTAEAGRLFRLALQFPGASLAREYLPLVEEQERRAAAP